tara:strand:+ start:114016 stop:116226 length:2211 start_codon:yes stop_codon:yes gene_type:complete
MQRLFYSLVILSMFVTTSAFAAKEPLQVTYQSLPTTCTTSGANATCSGTVGNEYSIEYLVHNNLPTTSPIKISGFSTPMVRDVNVVNNCQATLAAGAECILKYTVTSSSARNVSQILHISNSGRVQQFPLTMTLSQSPSALSFLDSPTLPDTVEVGTDNEFTYTVSNDGGSAAIVSASLSSEEHGLTISQNDCDGSLAAGSACTIILQYQPTEVGAISTSLDVTKDGDEALSQNIDLEAIDTSSPLALTIEPTAPSGGWATHVQQISGDSAPVTVLYQMQNTSDDAVSYTVSAATALSQQTGETGDCSTSGSLASEATCNLRLQFQCTSGDCTAGSQTVSASVEVDGNDVITVEPEFNVINSDLQKFLYENGDGTHPLPGDNNTSVTTVARHGDYLYVGTSNSGLAVAPVDATTSEVTSDWTTYDTTGGDLNSASVKGVTIDESDHLYVANDAGVNTTSLIEGVPTTWSKYTNSAGTSTGGFNILSGVKVTTVVRHNNYIAITKAWNGGGGANTATVDSGTGLVNASWNLYANSGSTGDFNFPADASIDSYVNYITGNAWYVGTRDKGFYAATISDTGAVTQDWTKYDNTTTGWPSAVSAYDVNGAIRIGNYLYVGTEKGLGLVHLGADDLPDSTWLFYTDTVTSETPFALPYNNVGITSLTQAGDYLYVGFSQVGFAVCTLGSDGKITSMLVYTGSNSNIGNRTSGLWASDGFLYSSASTNAIYTTQGLAISELP